MPSAKLDHGYIPVVKNPMLRFNIPSLTHLFSISQPKRAQGVIRPTPEDLQCLVSGAEARDRIYQDVRALKQRADICEGVQDRVRRWRHELDVISGRVPSPDLNPPEDQLALKKKRCKSNQEFTRRAERVNTKTNLMAANDIS